jgi:predicted phosphodiesterase
VRTLVLSDIHGNWPALEAVAAVPHDAVVCLGDIVGYGPQPGECLRWLRASGAEIVQGNHDRALADGVPSRCRLDFEWLAGATLHIARGQLTDEETAFVGHTHLPFHFQFGDMQVISPGSLGQPKDGDPRAAYAVIEDGVARLERVRYPVERTIDALGRAGLDPAAFGALSALLRTGRAGGAEPGPAD